MYRIKKQKLNPPPQKIPDKKKKTQKNPPESERLAWSHVIFYLKETMDGAFLKEFDSWSTGKKIKFIVVILLLFGVSALTIASIIQALNNSNSSSLANMQVAADSIVYGTSISELGLFKTPDVVSSATYIKMPQEIFIVENDHKIVIGCHAETEKMLNLLDSKKERRELERALRKEIKLIKEVIPRAVHPELLARISEDPTFSIQVRHATFMPQTASGTVQAWYDPVKNIIALILLSEPDAETIVLFLKNEFNHASIRHRNYQILGKKEFSDNASLDEQWQASFPLYENNWCISEEKANNVFDFLKKGEQRVLELYDLFQRDRKGEQLSENQNSHLLEGLDILKDYITPIFSMELSRYNFDYLKNKGQVEEIMNGHVLYLLPKVLHNWKHDLYIIKIKSSNEHTYTLKVTEAKDNSINEKARTFFNYFFALNPVDKFDGAYDDLGVSKYSILAEKCSDVDNLPNRIRQFLYSEICEYMANYLDLEKYCIELNFNLRVGKLG
jgi:hypothetical protein